VTISDAERSEINRANVLARWAKTPDRRGATSAATLGYLRRYLPADYDHLEAAQQEQCLDAARRAHCARMRAARAARRAARDRADSAA
jgi:hypothetical protein